MLETSGSSRALDARLGVRTGDRLGLKTGRRWNVGRDRTPVLKVVQTDQEGQLQEVRCGAPRVNDRRVDEASSEPRPVRWPSDPGRPLGRLPVKTR